MSKACCLSTKRFKQERICKHESSSKSVKAEAKICLQLFGKAALKRHLITT